MHLLLMKREWGEWSRDEGTNYIEVWYFTKQCFGWRWGFHGQPWQMKFLLSVGVLHTTWLSLSVYYTRWCTLLPHWTNGLMEGCPFFLFGGVGAVSSFGAGSIEVAFLLSRRNSLSLKSAKWIFPESAFLLRQYKMNALAWVISMIKWNISFHHFLDFRWKPPW